jgi:asparagine synthase (glutamine-hydrolysing)
MTEQALARTGCFDVATATALWRKCTAQTDQFSNADNMAVVGVLSTQLLDALLVQPSPVPTRRVSFRTLVDYDDA